MKDLFSIGELAALFNINVKTLRYYDEIGLLTPERTAPRTGYRYYSTRQFERLNTILYLRALQVPLERILNFFQSADPSRMIGLLNAQRDDVRRQRQDLERMERKLDSRLQQLTDAYGSQLGTPRLQWLSARPAVFLRKAIPATDDLEYPIRELEQAGHFQSCVFLGKIGVSLEQQAVLLRDFSRFSGIFLLLEQGDEAAQAETLPAGEWLTLRFSGTHTQAAPSYEQLLTRLEEQGLTLNGDALEITLIDSGMTDDAAQFVTELQLPVKKRENCCETA